jgi:hypothetical protein
MTFGNGFAANPAPGASLPEQVCLETALLQTALLQTALLPTSERAPVDDAAL